MHAVVPTSFLLYRNRKVLVDDVYSTEKGSKRWKLMRKWIQDMDDLLDSFGL